MASDRGASVMKRQIVLNRPMSPRRRQPLLPKELSPTGSARFAEVAGGTAAECAAVCCCCPCGIVNLVVLAVVKLPAGLWKKVILKKSRKRKISSMLQHSQQEDEGVKFFDDMDLMRLEKIVTADIWPDKSPSMVVLDMEQEMWNKFYRTGFWRNPSGRENSN